MNKDKKYLKKWTILTAISTFIFIILMSGVLGAIDDYNYLFYGDQNSSNYGSPQILLTNVNNTIINSTDGFTFDNTNYLYSATPISFVNSTNNWAISGWVKDDDYNSGFDKFVSVYQNANDYTTIETNGGYLKAGIKISGVWSVCSSTNTLTNNQWYQFILTYDGNKVYCYINNTLQTGTTSPNNLGSGSGTAFGTSTAINNYNANGSVMNIKFYNHNITQSDANALFNEGRINTCVSPVDNTAFSITTDYTMCSANYQGLNITMNQNNIVLDCQGATITAALNGSGSFVVNNFKNNWTVQNCNIKYYDKGINVNNPGNNVSILNNNVTVLHNNNGIYVDRGGEFRIIGNRVVGVHNNSFVGTYATSFLTNGTGIQVTASTSPRTFNGLIENNTLHLLQYGISVKQNNTGTVLKTNTISEIGSNGYAIYIDYPNNDNITVVGNTVVNGGWDAISVRGKTLITGNTVTGWFHHGIDTLVSGASAQTLINDGTIIENNTLIDPVLDDPSYNTQSVCVLAVQAKNVIIRNNYCLNSHIRSYMEFGSEYLTTNSHQIINNTILNASEVGILSLLNNSVVRGNTIYTVATTTEAYELDIGATYGNRSLRVYQTIENNSFPNGTARIKVTSNGNYSLTFINNDYDLADIELQMLANSGNSLSFFGNNHTRLGDSASDYWFLKNFTSVGNFSIVNNLLNIYGASAPYNDLKNLTSGTVIQTDFTSTSVLLGDLYYLAWGNYSVDPVPPSPPTGVSLYVVEPSEGLNVSRFLNISWVYSMSDYILPNYFGVYFNDSYLFNVGRINSSQSGGADYTESATYVLMGNTSVTGAVYKINYTTFVYGSIGQSSNTLTNIYFKNGSLYNFSTSHVNGASSSLIDIPSPFSNYNESYVEVYAKKGTAGAISVTTTIGTQSLNTSAVFDNANYNLSIGDYVINVSAFNSTGLILSNSSGTFSLLSNALLNVSAFYDGSLVVANITLTDNTTFITQSSVGSSAEFNVVEGRTYLISVVNSTYSAYSSSTSIGSYGTSYFNASLNPKNAIYLYVYDLSTGLLINSFLNVSVTAGTVTFYNTSSGELLLTNLAVGLNELRIWNANYSESRFSVVVANNSFTNLTVYLSNAALSGNVTFTFYNPDGAIVSDVWVGEYVLVGDALLLVQSDYTDINGKVYFSYTPSFSYSYNYSAVGYVTREFVLNPPREENYDITMPYATVTRRYSFPSVTGVVSFNNVSGIVEFTYVSSNSSFENYSWSLSQVVGGIPTAICYGDSGAAYSSFNCNTTGYTGEAYVQGVVDGQIFFGQYVQLAEPPRFAAVLQKDDAAFWAAILLMFLICGAITFGVWAVLGASVFAYVLLGWLQMIDVVTGTAVTVVVVASLIIALSLRRD